jgi:hypothetical protein
MGFCAGEAAYRCYIVTFEHFFISLVFLRIRHFNEVKILVLRPPELMQHKSATQPLLNQGIVADTTLKKYCVKMAIYP